MVVRMRHTRAHTRNRRSHHALNGARLSVSKESGALHPRHKALLDGTPYRGRSVMDKKAKVKKVAVAKKAPAKKTAEKKEKVTKKETEK